MARLQFRVWDKEKKTMLYDNFIIRHGNPASQEWYDNYNDFQRRHDFEEIKRPEYTHCHAEPTIKDDKLNKMLDDYFQDPGTYEVIDWSNYYFENYVTMQATGMHDKHGVLIWEGDLLKFGELVYPVQWFHSCYIWNGQMLADFRDYDQYGNLLGETYQGDVFGLQTENVEIVGNIFEHGKQYEFSEESILLFTPSLPV